MKVELQKDHQKKLKAFSKIIMIFAKIVKVLLLIGAVFTCLFAILTPLVSSKIKIEENKITVYGEEVFVEKTDESVKIYQKDGSDVNVIAELTSQSDIDAYDTIMKELEDGGYTRIVIFCEVAFIVATAILVLNWIMFKKVVLLFESINNDDTPFKEENSEYLRKIAALLLASWGVSIVFSLVSGIILQTNSEVNLNLTTLVTILVVYVVSYIFEYGTLLQNESKEKIYTE